MEDNERRTYNIRDLIQIIRDLPEGMRAILYEQLGVVEVSTRQREEALHDDE